MIRYQTSKWVMASEVQSVEIDCGELKFAIKGRDYKVTVSKEYSAEFLNGLYDERVIDSCALYEMKKHLSISTY